MPKPRNIPTASSTKRNAITGCGLIGGLFILLIGLWWAAAMKNPMVKIPTPVMPTPNAFDFYVTAGNALVNDKQISDAISSKPTVVYTWAQKETMVQQNAGAINTLHQGFAYPYLNPPARSASALFPYYSRFRAMARLLELSGQVKAQKGDWSGAMDSYLDAVQLGEEAPHGSVLIGELVGVAAQAIGRRMMWDSVEHLNVAQSRATAARLESIMEKHFEFAKTLEEEKWFGQSALLELFRDPKASSTLFNTGNGGADPNAESVANAKTAFIFLVYNKRWIMHNYTNYMDRSIERARQPYALHLSAVPMPNDPINNMMLPAFSTAQLKDVTNRTQNGLLLVMLALHAFQAEHGHYPAALTELAPAYLKRLPADPFGTQGTFQYHVRGKSYTLYSIGPDGKDDGGKVIDDVRMAHSTNKNARYYINENSIGDAVAGKNRY